MNQSQLKKFCDLKNEIAERNKKLVVIRNKLIQEMDGQEEVFCKNFKVTLRHHCCFVADRPTILDYFGDAASGFFKAQKRKNLKVEKI